MLITHWYIISSAGEINVPIKISGLLVKYQHPYLTLECILEILAYFYLANFFFNKSASFKKENLYSISEISLPSSPLSEFVLIYLQFNFATWFFKKKLSLKVSFFTINEELSRKLACARLWTTVGKENSWKLSKTKSKNHVIKFYGKNWKPLHLNFLTMIYLL